MHTTLPQRLRAATLIGLFSLIWSSAFIVGKPPVEALGPLPTLALRFAIAAALLLPIGLAADTRLLDWNTIRAGAVLGLLNNVIYLGLTFTALHYLPAALVVVIVSCAPFMTTLFAVILGSERLSWRKITGALCGVAGVMVMTGATATAFSPLGLSLAAGGTGAFALGTVLFHRHATGLPVLQLNFWQSLIAAIVLAPLAIQQSPGINIPSTGTLLAILYLSVVVTIGGMALWLILIRRSNASTASSYHLLNPISGLLLSALVLETAIQPRAIAGVAIVVLGLYFINASRVAAAAERYDDAG